MHGQKANCKFSLQKFNCLNGHIWRKQKVAVYSYFICVVKGLTVWGFYSRFYIKSCTDGWNFSAHTIVSFSWILEIYTSVTFDCKIISCPGCHGHLWGIHMKNYYHTMLQCTLGSQMFWHRLSNCTFYSKYMPLWLRYSLITNTCHILSSELLKANKLIRFPFPIIHTQINLNM